MVKKCILYYSGSRNESKNGVGIILTSDVNAEFDLICERICKVRIQVNNNLKVDILSLCAPTLNRSDKNHEIRENFYTKLDSILILRNISNRHIVIIAGDFNAKQNLPSSNWKVCKRQVNINGAHLLNCSSINNLKLVNTFFKHKPTHIASWTSLETLQEVEGTSIETRSLYYCEEAPRHQNN